VTAHDAGSTHDAASSHDDAGSTHDAATSRNDAGSTHDAATSRNDARSTRDASSDGGSDLITLPANDPTLDQPCGDAGTLTARNAIDGLLKVYTSTYTPSVGSGGPTALTIGVAYDQGAVTCTPGTCSMGQDPACFPASLAIDLAMTFKTADGTFNEAFTATVNESRLGDGVGFTGAIPATQLEGTYKVTTGTPSQVTVMFEGNLNYPKVGETQGIIDEESATVSAGTANW
jgi:hypothetical protein